MDGLFMEQHFLRSQLRLYPGAGGGPDPMDQENNNAAAAAAAAAAAGSLFSAAMMEKARAHLQVWGRAAPTAYTSAGDLHATMLAYRGAALWGQWAPQPPPVHAGLPPGLLGPPPPPPHSSHRPQLTPPPSATSTPSSSNGGSPSPTSAADLRLPKAMFSNRYTPYPSPVGARQNNGH